MGGPVPLRAADRSGGSGQGKIPVTLTANGEMIANTSVTPGINETRSVSLEPVFEEPGDHNLAPNNRSVGTISVDSRPTRTPASTSSPTETVDFTIIKASSQTVSQTATETSARTPVSAY